MRIVAGLFLAATLLSACEPQLSVGRAGDADDTGAVDYASFCASCHGFGGRGDGPSAAGLATPPADLTQLAAANGGTFPMLEVIGRIDGYTSDTSTMPEFGPLLAGDTVLFETEPGVMTPTPARMLALADYIAGLQE